MHDKTKKEAPSLPESISIDLTHWYTANDIDALLKRELADGKEAHVLSAQCPLLEQAQGGAADLFKQELTRALERAWQTQVPSVMPINLIKSTDLDSMKILVTE